MSEQIEFSHLVKLYSSINAESPPGQTYIIHQNRPTLHPMEDDMGFHGPHNDLVKVILQDCEDGDRILMHDGNYHLRQNGLILNKNIQIIGVGNNVTITWIDDKILCVIAKTLYLEKINFVNNVSLEHDTMAKALIVAHESKLIAKECKFENYETAIISQFNDHVCSE